MHHNSKAYQARFWAIWQANGSVQPKKVQAPAFTPLFVTEPPPTAKVTRVINRTIKFLNDLEKQVRGAWSALEPHERGIYFSRESQLEKLLEEMDRARYQAHLCGHFLAREYLTRVYSETDEYLKPFAPQLSRIIGLLRWCEDNDRRPSYTWRPIARVA